MNRAMQIANYIVQVALDKGEKITNLHLQKILYYLQAESLVSTGDPLFEEDIEKWRLGPVVPEVYHEYKGYGSQPITEIAREVVFDPESMDIEVVEFDESNIDAKVDIKSIIAELIFKNPYDLVDETHRHDPWKEFKKEIVEEGTKGLRYTNEEIRNYFLQNPDRLADILGRMH